MQTGRMQGVDDPHSRVSAVVGRHERTLLRIARQFSLCQDDALDAYQRALEIFVRRVASVDPATEVAWLKVVIRHEAMAIRRARTESVTGEEVDVDAFVPGPDRSVEDQIASGERVRRSAEALRALKPDEAQALMMKAHGLSYQEIGERNGWSYTKVNRAITEGRRRFMRVYEGIESGAECERFSPIVEALACGEATSEQVLAIRPHLRHCSACRATVRDLHLSRLRRASLLWPIGVLAIPLAQAGSSGRRRAGPDVPSLEEVLEIEPASAPGHGMFATLKHEIAALLHRLNASDAATGLHIATSSGGGRISSLAAIVALCLSGLTAGTVCIVTGVIPDPLDRIGPKPPAHVRPETRAKDARDSAERDRRRPVLLPDKPAIHPVYSATHDPKPRDDDARPDSRRAQRQVVDEGSRRSPEQPDPAQTEFGVEQAMSASSTSTRSQGSASQPDAVQAELDPAEKEFAP